VIVDDGSEPSVYSELAKALQGFGNIALSRNEKNIGLVRNWNECLRRATGEWICLLCSDDYFREGAVGRILEQVSRAAPCLILQDPGIEQDTLLLKGGPECSARIRLPFASGNVWHSSIYARLGGFDEEIKYSPDAEYWYRIAASYDVLLVRESFAEYVCHQGNYMWQTWLKDDFLDQIRLLARKNARHRLRAADDGDTTEIERRAVLETIETMLQASAAASRREQLAKALSLSREYGAPRSKRIAAIKTYAIGKLGIPELRNRLGAMKRRLLTR